MTLKQKTFSAVRWTTLSMVGKSGFQFLQIVVLARILVPGDFGLMALVVAVIGFSQIFADMGVSNAIIHHQKISHEELSSLYWLNVLASAALMLVLILASPWLADLYHAPRLQHLLMVISLFFLITALGQQLRVVAEKNLLFSQLAKIELFASFAGLLVSVCVAYLGGGVWALVAGLLTTAALITVLAWMILSQGWRPLHRLHFGEIRHFLSFGSYTIGNNLVNAVNSNADIFIGGRILGTTSLGVYSLPRELSLRLAGVVNPIVTRVGLPVMSKAQSNKELLKLVYLKTMRMTASINFPIYLALAVFAPEAVMLFFGGQWQESVPLLRILAVWGMLRSIGNPVGSLIFAVGRADLAFKWNLGLLFFIVPTVWMGAHYGNAGLAIAWLILGVIGQIPNWYILVRPLCGAGFFEYFKQLVHPFICAVLATFLSYLSVIEFVGIAPRLIVGLSVGGVSYVALSYWLNREWIVSMVQLAQWKNCKEV